MATIALQYAGQALGTFLGGPLGGVLGRAGGALAGGFIDAALFGSEPRKVQGPRLNDLRVMASSEGAAVPRLWGRARVAGQVIWATRFEEVVSTQTETASSKGGGAGARTKVTEYRYFANFALALAEGPVTRIGRAWADGKDIDIAAFEHRLHEGSETQPPDSLIEAKEGAGNAPAYRGLAYVVFERMPLARFGNRLPQLSFEVFGAPGDSETRLRAVSIIPGSSEFGYDPLPVTRRTGEGATAPENTHASEIRSDWDVSIDALTGSCPNLEAASLVVAWFGDDLRCGSCAIRPGVENAGKVTHPHTWKVAGQTRAAAHVVSTSNGHPAFGGTPSDASVVRAILDLKARGLRAVFHPFVLMDIAAGNTLPDPYSSAAGQPAYPWRGRITCSPAPGQPGTPDKTAAALAQVQALVGTALPAHFAIAGGEVVYAGPAEWSLRRMVLHYAMLCQLAGGVDAFLIGSELRGLTTVRDGPVNYPFVAALKALAADVAAILPDAKLSYAADWLEYFGHHPQDGSGDVFFHLDPLWSDANIDFVGIDNYLPLSDWRDGAGHLDRALAESIHDPAYLAANVAGGEGHDWYYASPADRTLQLRTPITDGAYGKPWVFRGKDIASWWGQAHVDRPGGVEAGAATAWVPASKPIWFSEAGCPAVDKGTNQPNVFLDAKSSESAAPYFSSGARDDLMAHSYLRALTGAWGTTGAHNPLSPIYGGPMVETRNIFFWAWDARPYPDFPLRTDVWADGENHARGHWLNGRLGALTLAELVIRVCADHGFTEVTADRLEGLVDGLLADRMLSARDLLDPLARAFAFDAVESGGTLRFGGRKRAAAAVLARDMLAEAEDGPLFALTRAQETELPRAVKLSYAESALDYRLAAVTAQRTGTQSRRETAIELPCAVGQGLAQQRADVLLQEAWAGRETFSGALPPSLLRLEPGDVATLALAGGTLNLRLEEIADGRQRAVTARTVDAGVYDPPEAPARGGALPPAKAFGPAVVTMLDLPLAGEDVVAHAPWVAAAASPWPGRLNLLRREGAASFVIDRGIDAPATLGELVDALASGPLGVYDRASRARVRLYGGALQSVSGEELLGGANAAAVGSVAAGYEILQFRDAVLVAPQTYEISWLLRGQRGSEPEMQAPAPAGTRFVLLDAAAVQCRLAAGLAGLELTWRIGPDGRDHGDPSYVEFTHRASGIGLRPLAPAQARAWREGDDVVFSWLRRTRIDGDGWELADVPLGEEREAYRVEVLNGAAVARGLEVAAPWWRYALADRLADFGPSPPASFTLRIAQLSTAFGGGAILERTLHV